MQYYNNQKSKYMANFTSWKLYNISDKILWKEIRREPEYFSIAMFHYCLMEDLVIHVSLAKTSEEVEISWTNKINFTLTVMDNVTNSLTHSLS